MKRILLIVGRKMLEVAVAEIAKAMLDLLNNDNNGGGTV